jgi:hypothetical protein
LNLIAYFGFTKTWWFFTAMLLLGTGMLYFAERMMKKGEVATSK